MMFGPYFLSDIQKNRKAHFDVLRGGQVYLARNKEIAGRVKKKISLRTERLLLKINCSIRNKLLYFSAFLDSQEVPATFSF